LLQEILWEKGYLTALVTDVYHLFREKMGFGRGFGYVNAVRGRENDPWIRHGDVSDSVEKYYLEPNNGMQLSHWYSRKTLAQYLRNRLPFEAVDGWKDEKDHFTAQVIQRAIAWLEDCFKAGLKDKIFLCVDMFAPHCPIDPPAPYNNMYTNLSSDKVKDVIIPRVGPIKGYCSAEQLDHIIKVRGGFISFVDRWFGILLDWMKTHKMLKDTLVIYVSDHGDFFGEHGLLLKCRPWPYDILSHAPLIIKHPN
jgi:arylsulfatase A-like enzyme